MFGFRKYLFINNPNQFIYLNLFHSFLKPCRLNKWHYYFISSLLRSFITSFFQVLSSPHLTCTQLLTSRPAPDLTLIFIKVFALCSIFKTVQIIKLFWSVTRTRPYTSTSKVLWPWYTDFMRLPEIDAFLRYASSKYQVSHSGTARVKQKTRIKCTCSSSQLKH